MGVCCASHLASKLFSLQLSTFSESDEVGLKACEVGDMPASRPGWSAW